MAIDALNGSTYRDSVNTIQKSGYQMNDTSTQNLGINITEVHTVANTTGGTQTTGEQEKEKNDKTTDKQIKDAITRANNTMKAKRTRCEFSYDEEIKRVSIKVVDEDTEEVVREIPPEETLKMIEKIWEMAGLLVDEKR